MADHFKGIYKHEAALYDALVRAEDYQGNILPAIQEIRSPENLVAVELGAGTGRLTRLLAPLVDKIAALDISPSMLRLASESLTELSDNWMLAVADHRRLPIRDETADLIVVGWSIGHFVSWYPGNWREEIEQVIREMLRVVRNTGTIIIIETMGTGSKLPTPPHKGLAAYYRMLETKYNFRYTWIRTDLRFSSIDEANNLLRFFFQDTHTNQLLSSQDLVIPECTGIWWRHSS